MEEAARKTPVERLSTVSRMTTATHQLAGRVRSAEERELTWFVAPCYSLYKMRLSEVIGNRYDSTISRAEVKVQLD
jgi:hypothetical protein